MKNVENLWSIERFLKNSLEIGKSRVLAEKKIWLNGWKVFFTVRIQVLSFYLNQQCSMKVVTAKADFVLAIVENMTSALVARNSRFLAASRLGMLPFDYGNYQQFYNREIVPAFFLTFHSFFDI